MELKRGPASLQRGGQGVRGTLVLDGRRLRFEPDRGGGPAELERIEIADIKRMVRAWTKIMAVVPIAPTTIVLEMRNGQTYRFTVSGRKAWMAAIEETHADTPRN